jgi:hypothetical protein
MQSIATRPARDWCSCNVVSKPADDAASFYRIYIWFNAVGRAANIGALKRPVMQIQKVACMPEQRWHREGAFTRATAVLRPAVGPAAKTVWPLSGMYTSGQGGLRETLAGGPAVN